MEITAVAMQRVRQQRKTKNEIINEIVSFDIYEHFKYYAFKNIMISLKSIG